MAFISKRSSSDGDSDAETLHETENPHRVRQIRISVIRDPAPAEIAGGHDPEWAAGTLNLDPVVEPTDPDRRVGSLISSVHDGVADDLLERRQWIGRDAVFRDGCRQIDSGSIVAFSLSSHRLSI